MNPELSKVYSKYLGVPYLDKGRDTRGWDCYGLYVYVLAEVKGIQVNSYDESYASAEASDAVVGAFRGELGAWQRIERGQEREGDGIVFTLAGLPLHCGYVLAPGYMLHTLAGRETCIERYDIAAWTKRIEGIYRWN